MSKTIFALLALSFSTHLAFAESAKKDIQTRRWKPGNPTLVAGSNGCGTANICVGMYDLLNFTADNGLVKVASGTAWCNAIAKDVCPDADTCAADRRLVENKNPSVQSPAPDSGSHRTGLIVPTGQQ